MCIHPPASLELHYGDADAGEEQGRHSQDQKETRNGLRIVQLAGLHLEAARFVVQEVLLNAGSERIFIQCTHVSGVAANDVPRVFVACFGVGQRQMDAWDGLSQDGDVVIEMGVPPGRTELGHAGDLMAIQAHESTGLAA